MNKEAKDDVMSSKDTENKTARKKTVFLLSILKYSDSKDVLLMILGTIGCFADGISMAAIMIVLSKMMNTYASTSSLALHEINEYALYFLYVATAVGSGAFLEGFCWARTADRQTSRLCESYLRAVLRQDVGFFDQRHGMSSTSQVLLSISVDTLTIQSVLSEKIPNLIMNIIMFITAQIAAGYLCWRLAAVAIPALSMLIVPGLVYGKLLIGIGQKIHAAYSVAGGISEQALSSIRVIFSYVGERRTAEIFSAALDPSLKLGIKQGLVKGLAIGSIGITFAVWALQAWYGSILVTKKESKGGDILTAGVCIVYGGLALGSSLINIRYFSEASIVASAMFEMIEHDVSFAYPSRPENLVLRKFNLNVTSGQTLGLVGRSGSGKSTIISLIERFYDTNEGEIYLDEISIKTLHLKWFRSQMSLVSQEPVLFATSIKENIIFGKDGASMEEVISAAKSANAHNFISLLPNGYDTEDALDQASLGRTTIIIAHRFSSLRNADMIAVIQSGKVSECGRHDQLIQNSQSPYSVMLRLQQDFIKDYPSSTPPELDYNIIPQTEGTHISDTSEKPIPAESTGRESKVKQGQEYTSFWHLMKMTAPEWKHTLLGCIGALLYGVIQPLHSCCQGAILSVFFLDSPEKIHCKGIQT
ncbi:Lipid A export ATP-binding/permease protein MsbA [Thalictrum thalictroides]|uniref:Lipid A export ATP-binding/permease protein MsbA n=1 Tax=Thalictrum thalictroides TaxID=46969 RepID=A0A7J6WR51_THATH|nr:Lipid A export ATP-binding/permease protein MsbA [Thalictrum thalictroides]